MCHLSGRSDRGDVEREGGLKCVRLGEGLGQWRWVQHSDKADLSQCGRCLLLYKLFDGYKGWFMETPLEDNQTVLSSFIHDVVVTVLTLVNRHE